MKRVLILNSAALNVRSVKYDMTNFMSGRMQWIVSESSIELRIRAGTRPFTGARGAPRRVEKPPSIGQGSVEPWRGATSGPRFQRASRLRRALRAGMEL